MGNVVIGPTASNEILIDGFDGSYASIQGDKCASSRRSSAATANLDPLQKRYSKTRRQAHKEKRIPGEV